MNRYTHNGAILNNNCIHRMIIVLKMLMACLFSLNSAYAAQAQSTNQSPNAHKVQLVIERTTLAYPFIGAKTINLTLHNKSEKPITLTVAQDYRQSIGINVFDKTEVPIPLKTNTENEMRTSAYTTLTIAPRGKHVIPVNLEDYVNIPTPGVYKIEARYYLRPDAEENKAFIASRAILIPITDFTNNKALLTHDESEEVRAEYAQQEALAKNSPDDVIRAMLSALQETQWETYFQALDLRSLYVNTTISNEAFGTLSAAQQRTELANFKERIIRNSLHVLDISPPDHFSIEKTYYTRSHAEVATLLYKAQKNSTSIKRFVFFLRRIHNIWKVVDYNARLVGLIKTPEFESKILGKMPSAEDPAQQGDYQYPRSSISKRE